MGVGTAVTRIGMEDAQLKGRLEELVVTMKLRKSLIEEVEARKFTA